MRIRELRLTRYGKFTDRALALPHAHQDIHFIVGPNEAGKSTVCSAIGDWLYGIPARTPLAFLHPMPELRLGGVLQAPAGRAGPTDELSFDRTKGNKNTLRAPDDKPLSDAVLQPWLAQVREETFRRLYALDHDVLVEGGDAILSASDDVGRMLFESAGGLQHLGQLHAQLLSEADTLWGPRKSATRIYYQAHEAFDKANTDLKAATLKTKDWKALHEQMLSTEETLADAKQRHQAARQQLARLERMRRVAPLLAKRDMAIGALQSLLDEGGPVASLPGNARAVYDQAMQQHMLLEADVSRLTAELQRITTEQANITVDQGLLSLRTDIQDLNERRLQYRAHATDIIRRREEVRLEWSQLQALAKGLGWAIETEEVVKQRLPAASHRARAHKLIKEHATLLQKQVAAQSELKSRQLQLQTAEAELARIHVVDVSPTLMDCLDDALSLGNQDAAVRHATEAVDRLQKRLDTALDALGDWRMEPLVLQKQLAPETATVQALMDAQRADSKDLASHKADHLSKQEELAKLEAALRLWVNRYQPVSREQVEQARQRRDSDWVTIRSAAQDIEQHAQRFEVRIHEADQLSDNRLEQVEQEAQRASQAEQIEYQRLEIQRLQGRADVIQARMDARAAEWAVLAGACGLPRLPIEMGPTWLSQRQKVLDCVAELADAKNTSAALMQDAERITQALWAELQAGQGAWPDGNPPTLSECIRQTKDWVSAAQEAKGRRMALTRQIEADQASLEGLKRAGHVAQAACDAWSAHWQSVLLAMGYSLDMSPEQVEPELDVMTQLDQIFSRMSAIRTERIDTMQADLDGLAATAQALAKRVTPESTGEWTGLSTDEICLSLSRMWNECSAAQQYRMALEQRALDLSDQRDKATQAHLAVVTSLNHLQALALAPDMVALDAAITRSDRQRDLDTQTAELDAQLIAHADGLSLHALRQELANTDPEAMATEVVRLNGAVEDLVNEISQLSHTHGIQKTAFDALSGSGQGAEAEGRRQLAIAAMSEAAGRYLALQTAQMLLKWSIERFRETRQGPMLAKASGMFQTLTQGSFARLLVDADGDKPRLLGIRAEGQQVDVKGMSDGTRDQLYLALRLAALDLQVDQGLSMPLIADDLFINFDDGRTTAGLQVLSELSRKMQIVFLTHHDHLVPLAQKVLGNGLNVVEL